MKRPYELSEIEFQDLDKKQLLKVVKSYIHENLYDLVPEYLEFEESYYVTYSGFFEKKNVIAYFVDEYHPLEKLEEYFNENIKSENYEDV